MMRKSICFIMLLALICSARGQTAYSYRYWFDADDSAVLTGTASSETMEFDISSLAKGALHALHFQALDARNKWGAVHTSYFFYTRGGTQGTTGRYWFDCEEDRKTASTVNGMLSLDTESLDYGVHALHVQMFDADGGASPVQTAYFHKGEKGSTARYWFDNEKTMQTASTINGTLELDIESLGCGIHAVHFQSFSAKGVASPVHTAYFYKGAEGTRARYWFDDEKTMQTASTVNGMLEIDIDNVGYGVHALHVQAFSANGEASTVKTVYFFKKENPLDLVDGEVFTNDRDMGLQLFTYSRTYKNTNWQAWYVPFDLTLTSDVLSQFSFAKFAGTYTEDDGTFFISVTRMSEGDVVKANTPYLVQAKTASTETQVLTLSDAILYTAEENGFSMNSAEKTVTIQGIYNTKTATNGDSEWYAFGGGKYIKASVGQTLSPYRFYMTITNREDNPYASSPNPTEVKIKVLGEDETGLSPIPSAIERGEPSVYDLSGRRIAKERATKGIYIINGKKVFVK